MGSLLTDKLITGCEEGLPVKCWHVPVCILAPERTEPARFETTNQWSSGTHTLSYMLSIQQSGLVVSHRFSVWLLFVDAVLQPFFTISSESLHSGALSHYSWIRGIGHDNGFPFYYLFLFCTYTSWWRRSRLKSTLNDT